MLIEVAIVSALIAGAGWAYLRYTRWAFDRKFGKARDPEPEAEARLS